MLNLAVLILLTAFLYIFVKKALYKNFLEQKNNCLHLQAELEKLSGQNAALKADNANLERAVEETIALYDITKDICKTLDEEEVFSIFRERINRYIGIGHCTFLTSQADLLEYQGHTVLPLTIHKNSIGYLVASDIKEKDKDKFHILAQQFLVGIKRALLYQKVQELTITDSLTQVFSRRYFLERFAEEIKRSEKFKRCFSFLMVDIDHFKSYNDRYGHLVGDAILREITKTIKENIRQIDFIGRYGGEELSIILAETERDEVYYAAERIREAVESRTITVYDESLKVTISIGVSAFPTDAKEATQLIDKADKALYLAKQTGRNRVCVFEAKK